MAHTVEENAGSSANTTTAKSSLTTKHAFWPLALGSLGVVYGDIGTSPLYALRESVKVAIGEHGTITPEVVYGILSLIIWALLIVVTLKYVIILLNADNRGEGGTLSLMALAQRGRGKYFASIPLLGMIGASLFFGDAIITPAISVLSAVEGIYVITPALESYVLPITIAIIVGLFAIQSAGTAKVARYFGPITLIWFLALAAAGIPHILHEPMILASVNPVYGLSFIVGHPGMALLTLGAVFLAVTGAEALYADLGHFGKSPIRYAWLVIVLPCLVLNYLGQGAMLLQTPAAITNPFYLMVPEWALLPMVILATLATIIASQAVITGAYSLTRQAIQLGLLPRLEVQSTSAEHAGQIYMPMVNWLLLAGVVILVVVFKSSSALATAYGIAVTGTMVVTGLLAIYVIHMKWRWSLMTTLLLMVPLIAIDAVFLAANSLKIMEGGWVPLALGFMVVLIMSTWRTGTAILRVKSKAVDVVLSGLVESFSKRPPERVPGTAVFFTAEPRSAPSALLHSYKHYGVLHQNNLVVTLRTEDRPHMTGEKNIETEDLGAGFKSVIIRFGYMDSPNVPAALAGKQLFDQPFDPEKASYFLSRRTLRPSRNGGMPLWQDVLFIMLARNANDASRYFHLPADRVVEIGSQETV